MQSHLDPWESLHYIPKFTLSALKLLAQNEVACSSGEKCGLKYVMFTPDRHKKSGAEAPHGLWEMQKLTKNDVVVLQSPYL